MCGMRVLVVVSDLVASWSKVRRRQVSVPCVESPSQSTVGRSSDTSERKPVAQLSDQMRTEIFEAVKGAVDYFIESRAVGFTQSQLESVPDNSMSRCELGKAFEDAVTKVILDHRGAMERFGNGLYNHHGDVARSETRRLLDEIRVPVTQVPEQPAGIGLDTPEQYGAESLEDTAARVIGLLLVENERLKIELAQAVSETMREGNG